MGAVYQASDTRLSGKVWAVKEMSSAGISDQLERQQAVDAFMQEAQLLATLSHPHIPKVVDVFSERDRYYLVMEFVEGDTLERRLEQGGGRPLPPGDVVRWASQICDVLSYLHSQNPPIVFRDLKPTNIMLDRRDNVKLIDFGIVRFFKPGKKMDTIAFGTAGYSPPEQYGKGQTDARSDIYALGATMHHLLTGRDPGGRPFHFDDVCVLCPAVPPDLGRVVMRALSLRPPDRWQSADEMRQVLLGRADISARATPMPAARARPAPSLADLMLSTGLKYVEAEPGVFVAPFSAKRRDGVLTVTRELDELLLLSAQIDIPRRGRDRALENLLRATYSANLVKLVSSAQGDYLLVVELNKPQASGEVLAAALRGLASLADLQENDTRNLDLVNQATTNCNQELAIMPDDLGFDLMATCRQEGIPCTDAGQGKYRLKFQDITLLLFRVPAALSFVFLTGTTPRAGRQEGFYHQMLDVNLTLNVGKVALDSDGELAFMCEVPVSGLDADGFLSAFWATLAGPAAFWDDLEQAAG